MAKRNAFTLAEVLITLGIIGVVAAMTLPTLLNSTQAAQFRSQFKKTMAVASQAVVVTLAMDDYDAAQVNSTSEGKDDNGEPYMSLYNMFRDRLNVVGTGDDAAYKDTWTYTNYKDESKTLGTDNWVFYLNDGSTLIVGQRTSCETANQAKKCSGFIDVNGPKNPNREVKCDSGSGETCKVTKAYDIIPIVIHGQTIEPLTEAGKFVLFKAGK